MSKQGPLVRFSRSKCLFLKRISIQLTLSLYLRKRAQLELVKSGRKLSDPLWIGQSCRGPVWLIILGHSISCSHLARFLAGTTDHLVVNQAGESFLKLSTTISDAFRTISLKLRLKPARSVKYGFQLIYDPRWFGKLVPQLDIRRKLNREVVEASRWRYCTFEQGF